MPIVTAAISGVDAGCAGEGMSMCRRADAVPGSLEAVSDPALAPGAGPAFTLAPEGRLCADDWPLRSYLPLGAQAGAVPSARLHARLLAAEWGVAELAETAELVTSELVTNAVKASQGLTGSRYNGQWRPGTPPVRLWVMSDHRQVLIQVWDGHDQLPRKGQPGVDDEHGRGLFIVAAVCAQYGVYRLAGSTGKVVWGLSR
jgi:anti-sigma regulatory factor (Ser/Thr protein kinase)